MSRFFVNTNPQRDTPVALGWDNANPYTSNRIVTIEDTVQDGIALQKMGTSIPHPFARLFVFKTAFDEVNAPGSNQYDTSYAKLVSECLDLLEFLYQYGSDISVREWGQSDLIALQNSQFSEHKRLQKALEKAMGNLAFTTAGGQTVPMRSVYLFYFQQELLGGTSPLSLVFTSPNIAKNLRKINADGFCGLNQNQLFQDYTLAATSAVPLSDRSDEFKEFLMHFYFAYQGVFAHTPIGKYIEMQCCGDPRWGNFINLAAANHEALFDPINGNYSIFEVDINGLNTAPVDIIKGGLMGLNLFIPLAYRKVNNIPNNQQGANGGDPNVNTDYQIRPDFTPENETLPLVLNPSGLPGATLVNNRPQPVGMSLSTSDAIADRVLPTGQAVKYPYIYADDLIEDKLIRLPYDANGEGFVSAVCETKNGTKNETEHFLIPVKPLLLKYFKVSRIAEFMRIKKEGDNYHVTLSIPIKHDSLKITVAKSIASKNVVKLNDGGHNLGVAVFPSYRVTDAGDDALNIYKILVSDTECNADVKFYKGAERITVDHREKKLEGDCTNHFYSINGSFDMARIYIDGASGLVVPRFYEVSLHNADVTVGVDFGTTNTYVCIKDGGALSTLSIEKNRPQVLTLNKVDLSGGNRDQRYNESMQPFGLNDFYYTFVRQFVPHILGTDGAAASFPFRTIACETSDFEDYPLSGKVLSDVSIGFNNLNETIETRNYKYISNLKWLLLDNSQPQNINANEGRIKMFIYELAWLIKNAVMLGNHPTKNFKVFTTYPGSMSLLDMSTIDTIWNGAFSDLLPGGQVDVDNSIKESAAPFLYLLGTTGAVATNSVNIDIGGGTTDILYIDTDHNVMYADSNRFAGNDIWGDGIDKNLPSKVNGFFKMIDRYVNTGEIKLDDTEKEQFRQQKSRDESTSADVMSFVFQNENRYTPAKFIRTQENLKGVLITHFSALCYHVAKTLKVKEINTRNLTVRFSGFGSKYINIILPNDKLIALVMTQMFKAVGLETSGINVRTNQGVSPKEITARGAVVAKSQEVRNKLEQFTNGDLLPDEIVINFGSTDEVTNQKMAAREKDVISEYMDFIDNYLTSGSYYNFLRRELRVTFSDAFKEAMKDMVSIRTSFSKCSQYHEAEKDDPVKESAFFWPFKETLVKASQVN